MAAVADASGVLDALDYDGFHREIFDGDGASPPFAPSPPYAGDPVGCNANGDGTIDAGDLSCLALRLSQGSCGAAALPNGGLPRLSMPDLIQVVDRRIVAEIRLDRGQQPINATVFELHYDPTRLALPANAFQSDLPPSALHLELDEDDQLISVALRLPVGQQLPEGVLLSVSFELLPSQSGDTVRRGVTFSARTPASFGNTRGQSVLGLATLDHAVVRTLVLTNTSRLFDPAYGLGFDLERQALLRARLEALLDHGRVDGLLVDLAADPDLRGLYRDWDLGADPLGANAVLFSGATAGSPRGLHRLLRELETAFPLAENLLILGDDRIVPFARLSDDAAGEGPSEVDYTNGSVAGGLPSANTSTVKKALAANYFLSDDPLASREALTAAAVVDGDFFLLPDLAAGRLVENARDLLETLDRFLQRDGLVDLENAPEETRVVVSGYDFSVDSAAEIAELWRRSLADPRSSGDEPVDDDLVGRTFFAEHLHDKLDRSGARVFSLNGHATHDLVGTPDNQPFGLHGLAAIDLAGEDGCGNEGSLPAVDLDGAVVIGMSCHGALPVPGSCSSPAAASLLRSFDLPETLLQRGALAFGDNTGFGWGLVEGVGLGERLSLLIHRSIAASGQTDHPRTLGAQVRRAKLDYYLRQLEFDRYDRKSLMQWTLYGFPMVEMVVPQGAGAAALDPRRPSFGPPDADGVRRGYQGGSLHERRVSAAAALPPHLTSTLESISFSPNDYHRIELGADGVAVNLPDSAPCPPHGCYWQLAGLSTDEVGLPLQPFYSSEVSAVGRVQRGVLWLGAAYDREKPFYPVVATPVSSTQVGTSPVEPLPIVVYRQPAGPNGGGYLGGPQGCAGNSGASSQVVVLTGELRRTGQLENPWEERRYRSVDLELLAGSVSAQDCTAPVFGDPPYDQVHQGILSLNVPVSDEGSGVWRVLAVWDDYLAGAWRSVELTQAGGRWTGTLPTDYRHTVVSYFLEAVDREGNVAWLERRVQSPDLERVLLEPVLENLGTSGPLFADGFESGDTSGWSIVQGLEP